jgi:protein-S-isoprenylcysteine O-methyltransferase Ste14
MANPSDEPVDYARTTRKHAGETMKNSTNAPGLIAVAVGVVAFVVALFAFATGHAIVGMIAILVAVLLAGGGLFWLNRAHRRVREAERRFLAEHPEVDAEPPTS